MTRDFTPMQWLFIGPITFILAFVATYQWAYHG